MHFARVADWLAWQETLHPQAIDLGLDRVRRVLARLAWQAPACPVVTVGGTNGKGSCVALVDSMLATQGYRTGTFTSPHLSRYNERIRIGGSEVSDASLLAAFERIEAVRGSDSLTFFEFNTLAALLVFETAGLDAVILEVGMGGRLDAVNLVDPDVALVTSIALDHCEWLGQDVETIGREKAGIFRAGRAAIFGSSSMPDSIAAEAVRIGARLQRLDHEFRCELRSGSWDWAGAGRRITGLPAPALPGLAQYANAASVVAVLESLQHRLPVSVKAMAAGLRNVRLPGRFEVHSGPVTWIFDVAHNPAAAQNLAGNLAGHPCPGRTLAVCGVLGDKDIESIAAALRASVDAWILAGLPGPRAGSLATMQDRFGTSGVSVDAIEPTVEAACMAATRMARPGDRIVVFGSFLTVGPAREWWIAEASP